MTVDMTNNRVPYGLLTDEEKAALRFYATQDVTYPGIGTVTFAGSDDNGRKARATLAEIEGEKK